MKKTKKLPPYTVSILDITCFQGQRTTKIHALGDPSSCFRNKNWRPFYRLTCFRKDKVFRSALSSEKYTLISTPLSKNTSSAGPLRYFLKLKSYVPYSTGSYWILQTLIFIYFFYCSPSKHSSYLSIKTS